MRTPCRFLAQVAVDLSLTAFPFVFRFYVPAIKTLKASRTRYLPLISGESETGSIGVEDGPAGEKRVKGKPEEVLLKVRPA